MKKYIVETYYTCTFKTVHTLNNLDDVELSKIDQRSDGEVEVIDVKLNNRKTKKTGEKKWNLFTHGGRKFTDINALEYCKEVANLGAGEILLTSMDRDGTKIGFDNELLSTVSSSIDIPVIASGGVGNLEHFVEGVLKGGASALLAASIFHFGEYSIKDVKTYLAEQNIAVRI